MENQTKEYLAMGFKLMPSGRINHHWFYCAKFQKGSKRDKTWIRDGKNIRPGLRSSKGHHDCCMSKKAYCHKVGCVNRRSIDDLSDLKDL